MIEGGWWNVHSENGSYIGKIQGDEFIIGTKRILFRINNNNIYNTEVPSRHIAQILDNRAITPNGNLLMYFLNSRNSIE